jgi:hypothetical protein
MEIEESPGNVLEHFPDEQEVRENGMQELTD